MTPRTARRLLWLVLLLTVPLPMLGFGALVPVARYLLLAGVTAGLIVTEGMGAVPGQLLAFFLAHALLYAGLAWLAAYAVVRLLGGLGPRSVAPATLGLVAVCLLVACTWELYVTPFASVSPRANLLHVLR